MGHAVITGPESPGAERLVRETRTRKLAGIGRSEFVAQLPAAAGFLAAAVAAAILLPQGRDLDLPIALALLLTYAAAARIEFHLGAVYAVPTQLVFVPMLFLVPYSLVPAIVAAGLVLSRVPEFARRSIAADRLLIAFGDAWFSLGPVLVLGLAVAGAPQLADWPLYLAALGAQFVFDAAGSLRMLLRRSVRFDQLAREMSSVYVVDALLSPIGLLAAYAAAQDPWAFLLVVPLLALLAIFSAEREARIENALTLSDAYRGTAHLLGELLSTSDEYTGKHSRSVVVFAHQVSEQLGLDEATLREVEFGALLHDVGKIAVPNQMINKPGALDEREWAVMKTHTTEGERMLERIGGVLEDVGHVVRSHHERWDGSGYPDGLSGEEIPIASRIISACDAFHAMTSDRSYRLAMPRVDAIAEMLANSGTQFDPAVVEALVAVVGTWDEPAAPVGPGREDPDVGLRDLLTAAQ